VSTVRCVDKGGGLGLWVLGIGLWVVGFYVFQGFRVVGSPRPPPARHMLTVVHVVKISRSQGVIWWDFIWFLYGGILFSKIVLTMGRPPVARWEMAMRVHRQRAWARGYKDVGAKPFLCDYTIV
jgi:hypothetical protein